jgi:hypothetical protein
MGDLAPGCNAARPAIQHHAGGLLAPDPSVPLAIPCLVRTGARSGEPTLGVCPKTGTVYEFPAFQSTDQQTGRGAMKSKDQGATWTRITPNVQGVGTHRAGLDPYFYLDPTTCRIFVDDWTASCTVLSFSDDEGASWTNTASNCGQTDHQTIFGGPPVRSPTIGYPNLVYRCAINLVIVAEGSTATTCQKSLDGGLTWVFTGSPAYVTDPTKKGRAGLNGVCDGASGHGAVGRTGIVYLPKGLCGEPMLAISKDEGLTWTRVKVSDLGMPAMTSPEGAFYEHEASVGVDKDGVLYYAWAANDRMPHLTISKDGGATWSVPLNVSVPGLKESALVQIAVGGPGRLAIVYMGSLNSPGHFPKSAACNPDPVKCADEQAHSEPSGPDPPGYKETTWSGYFLQTVDALDANPTFQTAVLDDPADPFVRGICGPIRCSAESDFLDVRIGPDGTPWAALVDGCTGDCSSGKAMKNNAGDGVVGRLFGGPSLLAAN